MWWQRGLLGLALALTVHTAFADSVTFQLPAVQVPNPGCEILSDFTCDVKAGPVSASFGTFSIDATGDMNNAAVQLGGSENHMCYPLSGTASVDVGNGDVLVFASSSGSDTICISQPLDANAVGIPPTGPWPLALTMSVSSASSGLYAGATGHATVNGTWLPQTSCLDAFGQPIGSCGFSGEELSFTLTDVTLPDLTLSSGSGGDTGGGGGVPGATPELDSLVLFGSGLASLGGYLVLRRRAGRR